MIKNGSIHRSRPQDPPLRQTPSCTPCVDTYSCLQRCEALGQSHQCRRRSSYCWCSLQTPWTAAGNWAGREEGTTNRLLPVSACQGETVRVCNMERRQKQKLRSGWLHWGFEAKPTVNHIRTPTSWEVYLNFVPTAAASVYL